MHRFATGETDVDRDKRLSVDAQRAMKHSQSSGHNPNSDYSPHTSGHLFETLGRARASVASKLSAAR